MNASSCSKLPECFLPERQLEEKTYRRERLRIPLCASIALFPTFAFDYLEELCIYIADLQPHTRLASRGTIINRNSLNLISWKPAHAESFHKI
jgi:hypothetical protein